MPHVPERQLLIPADGVTLPGDLGLPQMPCGLVIFVHGSGSSRRSVRNRAVAEQLQHRELATLLFDLLTPEEDLNPRARFDIPRLTRRLLAVTEWIQDQEEFVTLPLAYFGASTGAAAALNAAAELGKEVAAVVSRGGRPDMAMDSLRHVHAPTLLIVGSEDHDVIELNRRAYAALGGIKEFHLVPGATHLFEEPGALEEVARVAGNWLEQHCRPIAERHLPRRLLRGSTGPRGHRQH